MKEESRIRNSVKFEINKEMYDREGRYVVVKGKIGKQMVTLINVFSPPDSEKTFFETLFDIIALEMEGALICRGAFVWYSTTT